MPIINVDYDDKVLDETEVSALSNALQKIVTEATDIDDVNVYANTAPITVNILPVEIFIRMSARFVNDPAALSATIRGQLAAWKKEQNFPHLINIYLIPTQWTIASDI